MSNKLLFGFATPDRQTYQSSIKYNFQKQIDTYMYTARERERERDSISEIHMMTTDNFYGAIW